MTEPEPAPVPPGAIVVGVDGSETALRAMDWAARYASLEGRPLVVACALGLGVTPEAATLYFHGGAAAPTVYEQMRAGGEAVVAAATSRVIESHPSVDVLQLVEYADARQMLLGLAEDASLVVLGSRGRGPFRSLVLGSVTATVAGRARCPVLVVPAAENRDDDEAVMNP